MKIAARRRLAAGVVATTSALVAGLVVAPALAAPNGLRITPQGAFNTDPDAELTFQTTDADMSFGAEATFTRVDGGVPFSVTIEPAFPVPTTTAGDREQAQEVDFTDMGAGLGNDGPADAGTYNVVIEGEENPLSPLPPPGGGTDNCTSCFRVFPAGDVTVTSVAPTSLRPGQSGDVSVIGNNFERGSRVEVLLPDGSGPDPAIITHQAPSGQDAATADGITTRTELKRRFTVNNTPSGVRDVRVVNLDGNDGICRGCFSVAGAELTSISEPAGNNDPNGQLLTITFNGPDVQNGTPQLQFLGNPGAVPRSELTIVGQNVRNWTGTSITADFDLRNAAPTSNVPSEQYQPVVVGDDGVNACQTSCRFSVLQSDQRQPTLTSLDRSTLAGTQKNIRQGETATFVATGTNFSEGATLEFDPPEGLTVTDVDFKSDKQLEVTISATQEATPGDKAVRVRLTDGKRSPEDGCSTCLTVQQGTGASPSPSASGSPQPGNDSFSFGRFAGGDRYATAARIATGSYTTAATALLANGESDDKRTTNVDESHFPDALAAAYLAGFRSAPTLLATETTLPQATKDALRSLQTDNVVIIGGPSAISTKVENELEAAGYNVTRVFGPNRYDTAKAVAQTPPVDYVGENPDGDKTAIVASGENYPDALVAGPLGYSAKFPVLITARAGLSQQTKEALQNLGVKHVLIPGGTSAVSQQTESEIRALGITTERFNGRTRSETATFVAAYAYDTLGFDRAHVDLARGDEFADALAGGPHAGLQRSPILLTATKDSIGTVTEQFLRNRGGQLQEGDIFGGLAAVSQAAEDQAERAIREGGSSSPSPSASASGSASPTASSSASPTGSASPSASPACTPSLLSPCPSASPSASPSGSPSPSGSASPTASTTASASPTATATAAR